VGFGLTATDPFDSAVIWSGKSMPQLPSSVIAAIVVMVGDGGRAAMQALSFSARHPPRPSTSVY
jgi:hypothetical protein